MYAVATDGIGQGTTISVLNNGSAKYAILIHQSKEIDLKKTPLRQVSSKQKTELARRSKLKQEYMVRTEGHCMTCGSTGDWRGLSLSHIVPLSRGGKTTRENTLLECYPCHEKYEKKPELRA